MTQTKAPEQPRFSFEALAQGEKLTLHSTRSWSVMANLSLGFLAWVLIEGALIYLAASGELPLDDKRLLLFLVLFSLAGFFIASAWLEAVVARQEVFFG